MPNDTEDQQVADEQAPAIQPERYVENDAHVPNGTDQYGVVLTRGAVDTSQSVDYATPLFRENRITIAGDEPSQDEYFLTDGQRAAAVNEDEGTDFTGNEGPEDESEQARSERAVANANATVSGTGPDQTTDQAAADDEAARQNPNPVV